MHWLTTNLLITTADYIGAGIFCFGGLMILAQAFQKSTGTGCAMLLLWPIIWPIFVITNWKESSYWFFFCLTGSLIVYIF